METIIEKLSEKDQEILKQLSPEGKNFFIELGEAIKQISEVTKEIKEWYDEQNNEIKIDPEIIKNASF